MDRAAFRTYLHNSLRALSCEACHDAISAWGKGAGPPHFPVELNFLSRLPETVL